MHSIRSYGRIIAFIGLLLLVGNGIAYVIHPIWADKARFGAGLGLILIFGVMLFRPATVRQTLAGRPVKYASNAIVMSLTFIGIVGVINFLLFHNNLEYDLTETRMFTLSEQTVQILESLDRPVQIVGFFQTNDPGHRQARDYAEGYLKRYSRYTDYLVYEFHDPLVEPMLAKSYNIQGNGLVFVSGNNRYELSGVDEQNITGGLLHVIRDNEKYIYFVTGHGEHSLTDSSENGYTKIKQAVERESYTVKELNLATLSDVMPSDVAVLILAGANRDLSKTETKLVMTWVVAGGRLMILADPIEPVPLGVVLAEYGLSMGDDLVADMESYRAGFAPTSPLVVKYPFHKITQGLDGNMSFFPLARSLTIKQDSGNGRDILPILSTGANSWAETDFNPPLEYDKTVDKAGPIDFGVTVEDYTSGTRLVVFGSAGFVSNKNLLDELANLDLFVNSVNWLAEEDNLISIRPKKSTNRKLFLTPSQNRLIIFLTLIVIPSSAFIVGLFIWWKRR